MADKLVRRHQTQDDNVYALFIRCSDGKVWRVSTNVWETFTDANLAANYAVAGVELGTYSRIYTFDVPTNAAFGAGRFTALFFDRAGASPAVNDPLLNTNASATTPNAGAEVDFNYDGTNVVNELVYYAKVDLSIDNTNSQDEWTVRWFRNGTLVGPDAATTPQIQIIKRVDGTDLQAATNLSQVGSTQSYKKDLLTTARITKGEAVIVKVTQTIDGTLRTWEQLVSRDV